MPDKTLSNPFERHPFIAIEGNIGSGKTTFCRMVAEQYGCTLILEQFTDNPFLPFFYQQPDRYAFPVELFFMTERHKQLQEHFAMPNIFNPATIADYYFVKTLLFAKNNLNEEEFRLFQRLFGVLNGTFPKPNLIIYLHRHTAALLRQINSRGRAMEANISAEYLEEIQLAYLDFFKTETGIPVVVIELGDTDFQRDQQAFLKILGLLDQDYAEGVHYLKF